MSSAPSACGKSCCAIPQSSDVGDAEAAAAMRTHSLQVGAPGGVTVRLMGVPRLWRQPAYLGHMANDPVGYAPTKEKYKELAEATGNAAFVGLACGLCVAVVATRSIQAGEEVLVPYTYGYWDAWHNAGGAE